MIQNSLNKVLNIVFSPDATTPWLGTTKQGDMACGFKIMAHQIQALHQEKIFWNYLVNNNVHVILCFRYNILMQYVSDLIAAITKQAACWGDEVASTKVTVDIQKLEIDLKRITDEKIYLIDKVNELGLKKQSMIYENFSGDTKPVEDLMHWLIGEKQKVTTTLKKQNPDALKSRLFNHSEVVAKVKRLGLGKLLEDKLRR